VRRRGEVAALRISRLVIDSMDDIAAPEVCAPGLGLDAPRALRPHEVALDMACGRACRGCRFIPSCGRWHVIPIVRIGGRVRVTTRQACPARRSR